MAYRLSKAFGSTPEVWLSMHLAFDLARAHELEHSTKVRRIVETCGRLPDETVSEGICPWNAGHRSATR